MFGDVAEMLEKSDVIGLLSYVILQFQELKLEVSTIYKANVAGLCKGISGISPQNIAHNMVLTYLHFRILKFPLIFIRVYNLSS